MVGLNNLFGAVCVFREGAPKRVCLVGGWSEGFETRESSNKDKTSGK